MTDEQLMVLKDSLDMLTAATLVNAAYTARLIELKAGKFDQDAISPLLAETDQLATGVKNFRLISELAAFHEKQTAPE